MEAVISHIEKPGERDSHKAVPIAVTPHRLIAAEVPLELSLSKPNATITLSVVTLSVISDPFKARKISKILFKALSHDFASVSIHVCEVRLTVVCRRKHNL